MKDKSEIKSRFKPSLLIGVLAGYAVVFLLSQVVQFLAGLILGVDGIHLSLEFYKLTCEFVFSPESGKFVSILVLLVPTFVSIFNIEINSHLLTKVSMGFYRNFFIVYQLVLIGYLLINVFIGLFSVVLDLSIGNDYAQIISGVLGFTMPVSFLMILVVLIILTGYINITTKRIMKYINI